MDNLLEVKNLNKEYGRGTSKVKALQDISLTVPKGQFVSIMGPSGSGKTTFLQLVGGLDSPSSGEIIFNGVNLQYLNKEPEISVFRRKHIGFVFQFFNLIPSLTAQDNIALPLVIEGTSKTYINERVKFMLEIVGLKNQVLKYPHQMSGGQQQRVAIARALVRKPFILLADEPTGNLDTKTTLEIMELLKTTQKELEQTIILVTHNPIVSSYADRVIYFKDGRIIEDELLSNNKSKREISVEISEKLTDISGGTVYAN
ncbi:hypothetical protein BHF71_01670 [Vulcanibacillus modesticaldus]|uniref:ABC transporter domain-containing protein n=1 Tax=Vulcanibacillus modesticaldus TaxID=337097 RepID=A0A1D2YUJ4_9BACI|nr:ABC transporter ATP-binding protein [Vulcanibacillus modesticaldus]OEF99325.1 hypothetical protein BHF71_01670 [Vulcanibacillus modesticaldus]